MKSLPVDITVTKKPLNKLEAEVLEVLKGYQQVSRASLQGIIFKTTDKPNADRSIRKAISSLRNHGYVIVSFSNGNGYELTTDPEKVRHYVTEQVKRARMLMRTAHQVKRAYGLRDQLVLSGYQGKAAE